MHGWIEMHIQLIRPGVLGVHTLACPVIATASGKKVLCAQFLVLTGRLEASVWSMTGSDLLEHAILVADAIAPAGQVQGGHRVNEAGSQAPQATISKGRILLCVHEGLQVVAQLLDCLTVGPCQLQVLHRVEQRAAHQELRAQVVHKLGVLLAADRHKHLCITNLPHPQAAHGLDFLKLPFSNHAACRKEIASYKKSTNQPSQLG